MNKSALLWKWLILVVLGAYSFWLSNPVSEKFTTGIDISGGFRFVLGVDYAKMRVDGGGEPSDTDKERAQEQALEVLRNRIDSSGTKEPIIYKEPNTGRIVFEIPGVDDAERQKLEDIIKRPAYLEFRLVHEDNESLVAELFKQGKAPVGYKIVSVGGRNYYQRDTSQDLEVTFDPDEAAARLVLFEPVSGLYEFMLSKDNVEPYGTLYSPHYVHIEALMDGQYVKSAYPSYDPDTGRPIVNLSLDSDGADRFYQITRDYGPKGPKNSTGEQGRALGIVMDDTLYSAPNINGAIPGGNAVITGRFTYEEASTLAAALRSGALPAPVEIMQQQKIDPTLGRASVRQGVMAAAVGGGVVLVFMLAYYTLAGLVVNLALFLDVLLLPLGMMVAAGMLGIFSSGGGVGQMGGNALPTLTLPGIAGLVLTIGMAVDANVLIFERIREEQKAGKRLASAIKAGYDKVFSTIFDANITTLLVAIILFVQGSGPIRGFAVMLTAGIIVSMYTALVFTRMLFDLIATKTSITKLKMFSLIPENVNVNFLGKRYVALALSGILILGTMVNMGMKGSDVLGVDFTGGSALVFDFDQDKPEVSETELRKILEGAGIGGAYIQYQTALAGGDHMELARTLLVKVGFEDAETARTALLTAYGESHGFDNVGLEQIGGQIGNEMKKKGIYAILSALIGIVIYISFRFEFAFAIGAITALAHDVLLTIGLYCLMGHQLTLTSIAALLTIVGYSVNDTIVVFDRIREDIKLLKGKPYAEIANISINQTLSRTLMTSFTTLLTVVMLLIFGGGTINDFALALFIGVVVGTYSSIFIATPIMLLWHRDEKVSQA